MSKFSQDNKIAQVVRVSAICSFWKINISYLHQTAHKIMSILINNSPEKNYRIETDEILTSHMLLVIYTCVTILLSCYNLNLFYMKNTLIFSQSEECEFFMYIIKKYKIIWNAWSCSWFDILTL